MENTDCRSSNVFGQIGYEVKQNLIEYPNITVISNQ